MGTNSQEYVIGVDLGGTNTVFGIVSNEGNVVAEGSIKTAQYSKIEDFVKAGCDCIANIADKIGGVGNIKAMGIGAPNGNYLTGCIEHAVNLPWKGIVPLAEMFKNLLHIPVALTNDAKAAALGEKQYGAAKEMNNFIMITLGTGLGSGIILNGKLIYGHDGLAGELGHITIVDDNNARLCGCGRRGCLETYCSSTGVARTARELIQTSNCQSLLRNKEINDIEAIDVSIAANNGDKLALNIFRSTGEMLGKACANFTTFCSPEAFIFFGGLVNAGDLLMQPVKESYDQHVMGIYKGKAKFIISQLMDKNAAVLGASALGWKIIQ